MYNRLRADDARERVGDGAVDEGEGDKLRIELRSSGLLARRARRDCEDVEFLRARLAYDEGGAGDLFDEGGVHEGMGGTTSIEGARAGVVDQTRCAVGRERNSEKGNERLTRTDKGYAERALQIRLWLGMLVLNRDVVNMKGGKAGGVGWNAG